LAIRLPEYGVRPNFLQPAGCFSRAINAGPEPDRPAPVW